MTREIKATLEHEARLERTSVSKLLERMTREWIASKPSLESDEQLQVRLHAAARKIIGSIEGKQPRRAELAKVAIRKRLAQRHGR